MAGRESRGREGWDPGRRRFWRVDRGLEGPPSPRSSLRGATRREWTGPAERALDARPWRTPASGGRDGSVCTEWEDSGRLRPGAREGT